MAQDIEILDIVEDLSYKGDVTPKNVFEILSSIKQSYLIDVRTKAEWHYVGAPNLETLGKQVLFVEWLGFPSGAKNENFLEDLEKCGVKKNDILFFLCRSGGRSKKAAQLATQKGFESAYNVAFGFEGDKNQHHQRGHLNGWRKSCLPWAQP